MAGWPADNNVAAIVAADTGTGCDMLHPGYGFASERPQLAARCAEAGVRFAGPAPGTLALFGDKGAARARARELGVPVLPGTDRDTSLEEARALLREHGAIMVKAVAGGGGRHGAGRGRAGRAGRVRGRRRPAGRAGGVLAGTQGFMNHRKTDRLLELADRERLPVVMFAEGGGGRPGDTDTTAVASLDVPTFRLAARLSGRVPLVTVVSGYCFAGNAALAGACDVIIATPEASLGMGGPAMIEGGGLGVVAPDEVGPMSIQVPNGVVDLLVEDEAAAVAAARGYLSYFGGSRAGPQDAPHGDQRVLRHLVPENRVRSYDVRPVIEALCDTRAVLTGVLARAAAGG